MFGANVGGKHDGDKLKLLQMSNNAELREWQGGWVVFFKPADKCEEESGEPGKSDTFPGITY